MIRKRKRERSWKALLELGRVCHCCGKKQEHRVFLNLQAQPVLINISQTLAPNLSLFDRKKLPVSPKAPHLIKLLKHLEMKKYDQVQRNERMDTPLHAIVRSDRKDKSDCLLILMVFSDYGTENIDIPAAFESGLSMVQLLLVFGANINAINDKKRTPLDMLINGGNDKIFSKIIEELKRFDAKHVDMPERQEKLTDHQQNRRFESIGMGIEKQRALSIDGLSPAVIAQKLETNLNELYDEYDCIHNFDMQMTIGLQQFELNRWKRTSSSAMKFNVREIERANSISSLSFIRYMVVVVLFLDGGGIRGLIQIEIMSIIEQRTGRSITELFDWIVGTSTGGVVW
uniref:PNPLA domain-containing protein n=1 Tax=Amphimedon queenslandica TaxID=400682 RepID=A0A1X7U4U8_AMPQE